MIIFLLAVTFFFTLRLRPPPLSPIALAGLKLADSLLSLHLECWKDSYVLSCSIYDAEDQPRALLCVW